MFMARTKDYQHFCPAARTLEVIGEKWSLLIVRDLLRGPQRYTDLMRCLRNITPKWLTLRLRDLEEAGVVASDRQEGRREVWYRLTDKGRELAPVLKTLAAWGRPEGPRARLSCGLVYHTRRYGTSPRSGTPGRLVVAQVVGRDGEDDVLEVRVHGVLFGHHLHLARHALRRRVHGPDQRDHAPPIPMRRR